MCVFGIYGIWGLTFIKIVLERIAIENDIVSIMSHAIPYLGFPFLIMAWYMFLKFCYELSGSKISRMVSLFYFFFHLIFFIGLGWNIATLNTETPALPSVGLIYIFIILDVILTGWGLFILLLKSQLHTADRSRFQARYAIISLLLLFMKVLAVYLFYVFPLSIPVFILFYFLSIVFPLLYFYYNIDHVIGSELDMPDTSSYDNLIARYGITRREREIIEQVCSGKSNQEIADALFISLQTVKDHTHRIYLKMDIKSRVQLIKMMQRD
jgi:DNA-binding CsgD family transcriptional regulator